MVRLDEGGVSDVVVIAFMFVFLVMSPTLLLGYTSRGLGAATDRQNELKTNHLYRTLEKAEARPGVPALQAAAEQLVLESPRVENDYLASWMENTLGFLRPPDYGIGLKLTWDGQVWKIDHPARVKRGENFTREGGVVITKAGGKVATVEVQVKMFKILE